MYNDDIKMKRLILIILLISLFLRFYNIENLFVFGGDEEHHVLLAQKIVDDFHIIWVGVNVAHLGIYHGPFWTYFTALWLFLTQDLAILGYVAAFIGVLTTAAVIFVGLKMFNKKIALLGGLLYATLPLMVFYDQRYWNPSITPLLLLGMVLALFKIRENVWWLTLFALCYGLTFHTHFSLLPMPILLIYVLIRQNIKFNKKAVTLSIVIFLMLISPLIAFDYFQKGITITTPLRINSITSARENKINPPHHFNSLFETLGRIWYLSPHRSSSDETLVSCTSASIIGTPKEVDQYSSRSKSAIISFLSLALLIIFFVRKRTWENFNTKLMSLTLLLIVSLFLLFPGGAYEYYIRGVFPLILFIPGLLMMTAKPIIQKFALMTLIFLSFLGIYTILTATKEYGLEVKKNLIHQTVGIIQNEPFELKQDSSLCHQYEGWRQLFITYGKKLPERSFSDASLGWHYPDEISTKAAKYTIILSDTKVPFELDTSKATTLTSGSFKAYLYQNY